MSSRQVGGLRWLAPELLKTGKRSAMSKESDIYSFGCVCYEVRFGSVFSHYRGLPKILKIYAKEFPFADIEDYGIYHIIVGENQHPEIPPKAPDAMRRLMENCWTPEPGSRPKAATIVEEIDRM